MVYTMRVEIATDSETVRIRLRPFYAKSLHAQEILGVAPAWETGVAEGYGYRMLGKNRRGLLVGGPSITIETAQKTLVISCDSPEKVSQELAEAVEWNQNPSD